MDEQTMQTLVRRLYRVERHNRRWRWITALVLGGIVTGVLMAQSAHPTVANVVEAEKFVLRDAQGKARAWLETANGSVNLALADRDEKSRALCTSGPMAAPGWPCTTRPRRAGEGSTSRPTDPRVSTWRIRKGRPTSS